MLGFFYKSKFDMLIWSFVKQMSLRRVTVLNGQVL